MAGKTGKAAKKPKLELTPIAEAAMPALDDTQARLGIQHHSRAPGGRIVATRYYEYEGPMGVTLSRTELVVFEPGATEARSLVKPADLWRPEISADGKRALYYENGVHGGVREIDLDTSSITTLELPEGIAGRQVMYVGDDQILCVTLLEKQMLLRRAGDKLEVVATIDLLDRCITGWPILNGRFVLIQHMSQVFLIAAKGDALHQIKKTAFNKEPMTLRDGRLFIKDAKLGWAEATNLEAVWAAL